MISPPLQAAKNTDLPLRGIQLITSTCLLQSRQQYYTASNQQQQLQHSSDKCSRMNHMPRTYSSGRLMSNTTTPTAVATSTVFQAVPASKPQTTTAGAAAFLSNNTAGGDREWPDNKPSTNNDIKSSANPGPAFNRYERHVWDRGKFE